MNSAFFWGEMPTLGDKEKRLLIQQRYLGKNIKILPYLEEKRYKSPDLDHSFKHVTRI
jgi:hypothetical protein